MNNFSELSSPFCKEEHREHVTLERSGGALKTRAASAAFKCRRAFAARGSRAKSRPLRAIKYRARCEFLLQQHALLQLPHSLSYVYKTKRPQPPLPLMPMAQASALRKSW
jgi:hypothetical protein